MPPDATGPTNSGADPARSNVGAGPAPAANSMSAQRMRAFVARIERLETEKADLTTDIREVYAEAKGAGFDPKTLRALIKRRRQDAADRAEADALLELYCAATGTT